jgi:hypothetical protein
MAYPLNPQTPGLFGDNSSSLRQHLHPILDALYIIDTHSNLLNMQKPAALHDSSSTPSQPVHELEFGTASSPPFGSSCGVPETRVSIANAHFLISTYSFASFLSLELSNVVVNVTKDHTIESRTHRTAAIWLTRIRGPNEHFDLLPHQQRRAG